MSPGLSRDIIPNLQPGDLLIYSRGGKAPTLGNFFDWAIKIKTWSPYTHVETYLGGELTHAARNDAKFWGQPDTNGGVGTFALEFDGLVLVRRAKLPYDMVALRTYIKALGRQSYDVLGLLRFFTIGRQSQNKQFCSELAVRDARAAGVEPFVARLDADLVSPRDLAETPNYYDVFIYDPTTTTVPARL